MQAFATSPIGSKEIIKSSLRNWWSSLKLIWPLILALVLLRECYCPSCHLLRSQYIWLQVLTLVLVVLVDITLWVAISVTVYRAFQQQTNNLWLNMLELGKRSLWLLFGLFIYACFISLAAFIGYSLGLLIIEHATPDSPLFKILPLLIGLPMIYVLVLLIFTLPLLIIEHLPVWRAFTYSASITGPHWFRAFFVYVGLALLVVLMRSVYMGEMHLHLNLAWSLLLDLLSFVIFVPLIANYYVLVMHDLKLRAL